MMIWFVVGFILGLTVEFFCKIMLEENPHRRLK